MDVQARARELADSVSAESTLPGEALDVLLGAAALVFRQMQREGATGNIEFADEMFVGSATTTLVSTPR